MAKRTRKQKQRAVTRRPAGSATPPAGAPAAPVAVAVEPEAVGPAASVAVDLDAAEPARRRVERLSATPSPFDAVAVGRPRPTRGQQSGYIQPLESEDAAIPFDRVPYVPADLRRVGIIAAVMIALIIVADIIVSNVVK